MLEFLPSVSDLVAVNEAVSRSEESIPAKDRDIEAIQAKARKILARKPTVEEIAEQEERRRANRLAEIMAPAAPSPRLIFRRNDDALVFNRVEDDATKQKRLVESCKNKLTSGVRPNEEEITAITVWECNERRDKIWAKMQRMRTAPGRDNQVLFTQGEFDAIHHAIGDLVRLILWNDTNQIEQRWDIEDRIAALEAANAE